MLVDRLRHRIRQPISRTPIVYDVAIGLRPAKRADLARRDSRIVIEGYLRSGNTYSVAAFVVANAIGLGTNSACSDYIQLHAAGKETLSESLAFIQQTAAEILKVVMPPH